MRYLFLFLFFTFPLLKAEAIVLTIQNEFKPEDDGAILEVSNVKGWGLPNTIKVTILPGMKKKVVSKNIHSFVITRVYGESQDKIQINCIQDRRAKEEVVLTYSEIDAGKLPDGCEISKKGKWTLTGGVNWEEKKGWREKIKEELQKTD